MLTLNTLLKMFLLDFFTEILYSIPLFCTIFLRRKS